MEGRETSNFVKRRDEEEGQTFDGLRSVGETIRESPNVVDEVGVAVLLSKRR